LVLDTNVVASGLLWNGPPGQLLRAGLQTKIQLYSSPALLAELDEILRRPKFGKKISSSLLSVEQIITYYSKAVDMVKPIDVPRLAADPDDDVVVGTALGAKAAFVVTGDRSLLNLGSYEGIRIVSVVDTLEILSRTL